MLAVKIWTSSVESRTKCFCKLRCLLQLHVAKGNTYTFQTSNLSADLCGTCNWLAQRMSAWLTANGRHTNCTHLNFWQWPSPGPLSSTNAASLIRQFTPLVNRKVCWRLTFKHRMKWPLHCNRRPILVQPQYIYTCYVRRHLNICECSASGWKIWKLEWYEL
jgi:hypothetical protein